MSIVHKDPEREALAGNRGLSDQKLVSDVDLRPRISKETMWMSASRGLSADQELLYKEYQANIDRTASQERRYL